MDRSNSIPRSNSSRQLPQSQQSSYRLPAASQQLSNSQMKFMNDLVLQQPPSQRQALNSQLEQLPSEQIREIQQKLENGEVLHGLSSLPEGANMTHKFIVKVGKHNLPNQQQQTPIIQLSQSPQPQPRNLAQKCPDCASHLKKLKEQDNRIESLLVEMNRMSQFLIDKGKEIDLWKQQYQQIQKELLKPKSLDNQDKTEIGNQKMKLNQKEYENKIYENQKQNSEDFELRASNNQGDDDQLQKDLYDALQDNQILKQDNDRLTFKLEKLQNELQNKNTEITTIYKTDPEIERQFKDLQTNYTVLQQHYQTLQQKSSNAQKEIQYETKVFYQQDPDIERQLQELQLRYNMLQQQFYSLQETSKIMQKEIQYETKVIYQNDPQTDLQLQKQIKQYDELYTKYFKQQVQLQIYQEQLQQQKSYETRTIYQPDPEIERQLQLKIDQLNQSQYRFNQLQSQYIILEEKSKTIQKEPILDFETEKLLKIKSQQLESMTTKYTILQEQIQKLQSQIDTNQTKTYKTELIKSEETDNQVLLIESLKEQIKRQNVLIEQYSKKIDQFDQSNQQEQTMRKQLNDINALYEQELSLNQQLKLKIEQLRNIKSQFDAQQYKIKEFEQMLLQKEDRIKQLSQESDKLRLEITSHQQKLSTISIEKESSNTLKEQIKIWKDKYEKLEEKQNTHLEQEINQYQIRYEQMEQKYLQLQRNYESIQIILKEYKENEQSEVFKMEIKRLQKTVIELRSEIDRLLVQKSDNCWLQKRYEEQQMQIESYKALIEEKQQFQNQYIYQIKKPEILPQFIRQSQIQQTNTNSQLQQPQSTSCQIKTNQLNMNQQTLSQQKNLQSKPFVQENSKFEASYTQPVYSQQSNKNLNKYKVDQYFEEDRWNKDDKLIVEKVTITEKQYQ